MDRPFILKRKMYIDLYSKKNCKGRYGVTINAI